MCKALQESRRGHGGRRPHRRVPLLPESGACGEAAAGALGATTIRPKSRDMVQAIVKETKQILCGAE